MSYILEALKKFEHERKRRIAVPELLIQDDLDRSRKYRNFLKGLLVASVVINIGLLGFWQTSKTKVTDEVKALNALQINDKEAHSPARAESRPEENRAINMDVPEVSMNKQAIVVQSGIREPKQEKVKGITARNVERRSFLEETDSEKPATVPHIKIISHDEAGGDHPNVRVWEDDSGNVHFSGTAGR